MPQEKLVLLTSSQPILEYLVTCDHILYQCIINFLIPNVLKPIPATLTQAVRNFAKSLESWMKGCLDNYMSNCVESKVIGQSSLYRINTIKRRFVCTFA